MKRSNIGIFGRVNVGKSTLMNILTQQETSIVDKTPGTTADIKVSFMEFHNIGPVKLFDTAGIDEKGQLGQKKQIKSLATLKECDLILLIIDPYELTQNISFEKEIISLAKKRNKRLLILYNIFLEKRKNHEYTLNVISKKFEKKLAISNKHLIVDFKDTQAKEKILNFIFKNFNPRDKHIELFPFLKRGDIVFLNIPMDEETPEGRLLCPQAFVQEHLIRRYISTFAYRMDLVKARSGDKKIKEEEYLRFQTALQTLKRKKALKLLITDSQAIDIVHPWTLDKNDRPLVDITTFSVIMAEQKSGGRLLEFIKGLDVLKTLKKGDKILIAEACNHNRIAEDIGTSQIPKKFEAIYGKNIITVDHAFGREFSSYDLKQYKLVIHCGGCMIDTEKFKARIEDLIENNVPITNYGILLSFFESPHTLKRVVEHYKKDPGNESSLAEGIREIASP